MTAISSNLPLNSDTGVMHLNWFSLRFTGPSVMLEEPFLQDYVIRSLLHVRIALLMGTLMYGLFGMLDALVLPLHKHVAWLIRYALVCPAILATLALTYIPRVHRYLQPIMSLTIAVGGLGIVLMIIIVPVPVNYYYYAGLILVFIFGYSFIYLRFLWASLSGWIIVILYEVAALFTDTPVMELISNNFFLISANIAGMLVCYATEYSSRRNFFLLQLLDREQRKIKDVNEQLEQRVAERTKSVEQMNRQLLREISERQLAEQERQRLEAQLKQAEKMETIGKLAAGVAHDLNNILSGLVTYPDILLLDIPENSELRQFLLIIKQSGEKAAAIVQDMLTLSRRGMAEKKVININKIIDDYLHSPEHLQLRANRPLVRLEVDLQDELLSINGSTVQLSKALMNLLNNAFEANLVDGTVTISSRNCYLDQPREGYERINEGEYVILTVSDTGIGIDAEDLHKIFEPFFSKKKLGRSGTGLGMTLIWSTVKDHGGFLDIRSAEGRGSTFEIYFPATRQEVSAKEPLLTLEDCRGTESVLVVDDSPEQREIASMMLRKLGYTVLAVASGESAVEYLQDNKADILVLDMIMTPGIDGCETYTRIVKDHPSQKAIIASGYSESERVTRPSDSVRENTSRNPIRWIKSPVPSGPNSTGSRVTSHKHPFPLEALPLRHFTLGYRFTVNGRIVASFSTGRTQRPVASRIFPATTAGMDGGELQVPPYTVFLNCRLRRSQLLLGHLPNDIKSKLNQGAPEESAQISPKTCRIRLFAKIDVTPIYFLRLFTLHVRMTGIKPHPDTAVCDKISLTYKIIFRIVNKRNLLSIQHLI